MDKMPAYTFRDAIRLRGFLKKLGPLIAEKLEPRIAAVLEEGEPMPDIAHVLDVLGRLVFAAHLKLEKKDTEKHRHNISAASARFDLRRDVMPVLRARVQEARKWLRTHVAPETLKLILPFKGRTPRSDEALEDLAIRMVRGLSKLEPVQTPGGPVDPAGWADYLREPLEQASGLLGEVDHYVERRRESVQEKTEATREYDLLFRRVARVGWIFCHLAGIEKTARKIVYKGGRPGVKVKKQGNRNVV